MPEKIKRQKTKEATAAADGKKQKTVILLKNTGCMLLVLAGIAGAAFLGSLFTGLDLYYTVRNLAFCLSAALAAVFTFQAGRISGNFLYDDGEYPGRFLIIYLSGILCALVFTKLPIFMWRWHGYRIV